MRARAVLLSALLVVSLVGAAATPVAGQQASGEAYTGAHVQFETGNSAVADYAVDGNVILQNVTMQSAEEASSQTGLDVDASLETAIDVAGASINSRTEASASVELGFESGAEMTTHDTNRGVVQFTASEDDQIVNAKVSTNAQAESEGDERVVVTKDDGSQGTFIVVGDGEVVVNEEGNVTAEIAQGSELVYRQYNGERSESDERQEQMIQNGTATAEVYVQNAEDSGEDGSEEGQEAAIETIEYGQDTTVEVTSQSQNAVEMAIERSESEGKVVLTSVSEAAFENAEDIEVFVDGNAAVAADSYSAVEQSAQEGDQPRYYVAQSTSAEGSVDVAIGIDHFSTRNVEMTSADEDESTATAESESTATDASTESDGDDGSTDGDGAGFGVLAALAALAAALIAARRR